MADPKWNDVKGNNKKINEAVPGYGVMSDIGDFVGAAADGVAGLVKDTGSAVMDSINKKKKDESAK